MAQLLVEDGTATVVTQSEKNRVFSLGIGTGVNDELKGQLCAAAVCMSMVWFACSCCDCLYACAQVP